ncbi:MAG: hypothetical protein V1853_03335 [bacterium]
MDRVKRISRVRIIIGEQTYTWGWIGEQPAKLTNILIGNDQKEIGEGKLLIMLNGRPASTDATMKNGDKIEFVPRADDGGRCTITPLPGGTTTVLIKTTRDSLKRAPFSLTKHRSANILEQR